MYYGKVFMAKRPDVGDVYVKPDMVLEPRLSPLLPSLGHSFPSASLTQLAIAFDKCFFFSSLRFSKK